MSPHAAPQVTLAQQLAHGALEGAALEWPEGQRRAEPAGLVSAAGGLIPRIARKLHQQIHTPILAAPE